MMNSVMSRAPRNCVSAKFHIRPKVSFDNRAFSKMFFAVSPARSRQSAARGRAQLWVQGTGENAILSTQASKQS